MLLLSKEDIKSVITMKDMIEADKQAFKMVVDGTVDTPLRTVINGKYDGAYTEEYFDTGHLHGK